MERFDRKQGQWVLAPPYDCSVEAFSHCAFEFRSTLSIWSQVPAGSECGRFHPSSQEWTRPLELMETNQHDPMHIWGTCIQHQNVVYIIGGKQRDMGDLLPSCEAFNMVSGEWIRCADMHFPRLRPSAASGSDGKIYVFGSFPLDDSEDTTITQSAECYDPVTNTWWMLPPMPEPKSSYACVSCPNGLIYLLGGYDQKKGYSSTCFCFDINTRSYSRMARLPRSCGVFASACLF